MKTILLLLTICSVCSAQSQREATLDSIAEQAARQTDIELFGTDKPTSLDVLRVIEKRKSDCDWIIEKFERYFAQLEEGKITVRDLKDYLDDIKRLIAMKRIAREMSQGRAE